MANTKTLATIVSGREVTQYLTLAYVDSQETDYIIYDSSAVAAVLGITDPLDSTIVEIRAMVNSAVTARLFLEWDATTDVLALTIPPNLDIHQNFRKHGGLPSQAGAGKTGDIQLTTTGLGAGDTITLILVVRMN